MSVGEGYEQIVHTRGYANSKPMGKCLIPWVSRKWNWWILFKPSKKIFIKSKLELQGNWNTHVLLWRWKFMQSFWKSRSILVTMQVSTHLILYQAVCLRLMHFTACVLDLIKKCPGKVLSLLLPFNIPVVGRRKRRAVWGPLCMSLVVDQTLHFDNYF